jgi:hypothetical protein
MNIFYLILAAANAKLVSKTVIISKKEPWAYISKFSAFEGTGSWDIKVKMTNPGNKHDHRTLDFVGSVYIEHKWEEALFESNCREKEHLSKRNQLIQVPLNGSWSMPVTGTFHQRSPYFWYFTISSCDTPQTLKAKFKVELLLLSSSNSHFSAEDEGLLWAYLVILISYTLFLYKNIAELVRMFQLTDILESHLLIHNWSIGLSVLSVILQVIHYLVYSYDGSGLLLCEAFADLTESAGGLLLMTLLLVLADGWTISYKSFPESSVYIPVAFVTISVNLIVVAVGRMSLDDYDKNSGYEGTAGNLLIFMRIALWVWFLTTCRKSYKKSTSKLQDLFLALIIIGSVYFLTIPLSVWFSSLWSKFYRKKIILGLFHTFQIFTFYFLTHSFSKSSLFYQRSSLASGILPGRAR